MSSIVQKRLLENDLRSLEELTQIVHSVVDDKIKKILLLGKNWLSQGIDAETGKSYENIKQVTESAISFMIEICQQLEGDWKERTQKKMSAESETKDRKSSKASAELDDITSLTAQVRDMEEKMTSLSQTVQRLTSREDLTESSADKVSEFEDDSKVKSERIDNTVQEMTTDMGRVQTDIEKMRNQIQDLEDRDNVMKRSIEMMTQMVQNLSSELTAHGKNSENSDVAFTASVPPAYEPVEGKTVTGYGEVRGNKDLSFSNDTGIVTALIKGLYGVCVRQWQWGSGKIQMYVKKNRQSSTTSTAAATPQDTSVEKLCRTWTRGHDERDFSLVVTEMEVGDTLRVVPFTVTENPSLHNFTTFSVFLINS